MIGWSIEEEDVELKQFGRRFGWILSVNKMLEVIQSAGKWKLITPNQIIRHEMVEGPLKLSFERLPSNAQTTSAQRCGAVASKRKHAVF